MNRKIITGFFLIFLIFHVDVTMGRSAEAITSSQKKWSQQLILKDYLNIIDYEEQLIRFPVKFPGTFPANEVILRLDDKILSHQLTDVKEEDGKIIGANVWFRTSLNRKEEKIFVVGQSGRRKKENQPDIVLQKQDENTAVIVTNKLSVRVPVGNHKAGKKFSEIPTPFISFSRNNRQWIGNGRFAGTTVIDSISAGVKESGPLFMKYRVSYFLSSGNRKYEVDITAYQFEDYISIDEYMEGFSPEQDLAFHFSYKEGINPNGRLVLEKAGYESGLNGHFNSGSYSEEIDENGELPYQLGQYSVVNAYVPAATTFWNDEGENAISVACYRMADWKTHQRYIWNTYNMPDNFRFYHSKEDQYMKIPLVGQERHWALKIYPRDEVRLIDQHGNETWYAVSDLEGLEKNYSKQAGADPAVRLLKKLNGFGLQWVVDTEFEWEENVDATYNQEAEFKTFEEFKQNRAYQLYKEEVCDIYWEAFRTANPIAREQDELMAVYAKSRSRWTEEQRKEIRALFLHYIYSEFYDDIWAPNRSMIGGHPNFMMEDLYSSYTALFPNHPDVKEWKRRYLDFFNEYKKVYIKDWDKNSYALGGRHTENIACYSYASMRGMIPDYRGLMDYDGTDILDDPKIREWLRWHMYCLVTPVKEYQYTYNPPQGAHSREREKKEDFEFFGQLEEMAGLLKSSDPELSANIIWALTKGEKGEKPRLESALFNDYGAVLRYDFGGPDEAYLNIQELGIPEELPEGYNSAVKSLMYRWRTNGNGILYYAAKDTIWSWNGVEDNGDDFDIEKCPVFIVNGSGLNNNTGHGVLYNFDWAQFYRATGSNPDYLSRDVMMIRDDYVAVYDNVSDKDVKGKFNWVNTYGVMPFIHNIREGKGDNFHVIEPGTKKAMQAGNSSFPLVFENGQQREYIFMSDNPQRFSPVDSIAEGKLAFYGRTAYASENMLAIFEGSSLSINGSALIIPEGDFGISAYFIDQDSIKGRISGRKGGKVKILPPEGFNADGKEVQIIRQSGVQMITPERSGDTIMFNVDVSTQDDYYIKYSIVPAGSPPDEKPEHPPLSLQSYGSDLKNNEGLMRDLNNHEESTGADRNHLQREKKLDYVTSWLGNSLPGSEGWVLQDIEDIYVTPDGTVYTNVPWDEHGGNVMSFKNGKFVAEARVGNHGGGYSITANSKYIYFGGDRYRTGEEGIDRRNISDIHDKTKISM